MRACKQSSAYRSIRKVVASFTGWLTARELGLTPWSLPPRESLARSDFEDNNEAVRTTSDQESHAWRATSSRENMTLYIG